MSPGEPWLFKHKCGLSVSAVEGREVPVLKQELESPSLYPREWYDHKAKSCLGFPIWLVATGRQGADLWCVLLHLSSSPVSRESHPAKHPKISERAIYLFLNGTQVPLQIWSLHFPLYFPMKKLKRSGLFIPCKFSNRTTLRLF